MGRRAIPNTSQWAMPEQHRSTPLNLLADAYFEAKLTLASCSTRRGAEAVGDRAYEDMQAFAHQIFDCKSASASDLRIKLLVILDMMDEFANAEACQRLRALVDELDAEDSVSPLDISL
jgi:hypothetical protein